MNTKTSAQLVATREPGDVEPSELIARAAEIANGAPLRFDRNQLVAALLCFLDFQRGVRRHLAKAKPGDAVPERLRYGNYVAGWETTHEAVVEARAHLHAFPADDDDFGNSRRLSENYIFTSDADAGQLKPGFTATRKKAAEPTSQEQELPAKAERRRGEGAGCWRARRMEVQWPGHAPNVMVEAIGIHNTTTGEFKAHEYVGKSMDKFMEHNPEEDRDELEAMYWREAEEWAASHNSGGL